MIIIRKVAEDFGWLGNMSPHPVIFWDNKTFRTSEALFQSLRFVDETVIEEIRAQKSPMSAKMIAKKNKDKMIIEPCSELDLENMKMCLKIKLNQNIDLKAKLLATGDELIVEDCTKRQHGSGLFWGAALKDGEWIGQNNLGRLWMEIREEIKHD